MNDGTIAAPVEQRATPKKKLTPRQTEAERLHKLRRQRYKKITETIPADWPEKVQKACRWYVQVACAQLGKRRLARVAWPWQSRPVSPKEDPSVRVKRGRLSNPTALR